MPDPALAAAIKEAYASAPVQEVVLHTLEFRHPSFAMPIRVVRDARDLTATLEVDAPLDAGRAVTFVAFAFDFRLPEVAGKTIPQIEIVIDNVGGEIVGYLDAAANSGDLIEVTYRPYLASDPSVPQMDPPLTLVVREVTADVFRVTATAGFGDLASLRFPAAVYTSDRFPGLAT